jgi:hypothetical protein
LKTVSLKIEQQTKWEDTVNHLKVYLLKDERDDCQLRKAMSKLKDWRLNEPDAKLLLQFNEPLTKGFAQKLIDAGVLSLLTTTACFVAPLVDRKQLVREHGYGALEVFLVAHSGSVDSPLTDQKFAFFCETPKQPSALDWIGGCHGH